MKKCPICNKSFRGQICMTCGWRKSPKVRKGASPKEAKHWEKVYGSIIQQK